MFPKYMIKTLWLEKLPDSIRNIILVSDAELPKLEIMAERFSGMTSSNEICGASTANNCSKKKNRYKQFH